MALDIALQVSIYLTITCLAVASVVSVAIIIERSKTLKKVRAETESVLPSLRESLEKRQIEQVRGMVSMSIAPIAALVKSGMECVNGYSEFRKDTVAKELALQQQRLSARLGLLATIASNSPYVGLFGTVCGIMKAFREIAQHQGMGSNIVANGIAEALVTTALGLFVAIPAGVAYNYFVGKVNYFVVDLDRQMADFEPLIVEERKETAEAIKVSP